MQYSRRELWNVVPAALITSYSQGIVATGATPAVEGDVGDTLYPSQDPDRVREFVGAAHSKLDRVREMLVEQPALARCAWDWGFGDWETALGAASHVGRPDIANLLIENGARPDVFTFAMLGNLDAVKAILTASPNLRSAHGPHGITLMKHALAGGEAAASVAAYLAELGGADVGHRTVPLAAEWAERYLGDYSFGPDPADRFTILRSRSGDLAVRRASGTPRQLFHQGDHAFFPAGAASVAVRITVRGDAVTGLEIVDGPRRIRAERA